MTRLNARTTAAFATDSMAGPTDAAAGLAGSGDVDGDAAVAWVQGVAPVQRIVAAQLYQPPGGLSLVRVGATNTVQPTFTWSPSCLRCVVRATRQAIRPTVDIASTPRMTNTPTTMRMTLRTPLPPP